MMDQSKNEYKGQYNEETSQVHAPADLIKRTRLAVAEEEKRLQAENKPDNSNVDGRSQEVTVRQQEPVPEIQLEANRQQELEPEIQPDAAGQWSEERAKGSRRNYNRGFRWAFSAAAAVILLFAVHRSALLWGVGASMDSASDMAAAGSYEEEGSMNGSAEDGAGSVDGEMADGADLDLTGGAEESKGVEMESAAAEEEDSAKLQQTPAITENSTSDLGKPAEDAGTASSSKTSEGSSLNRGASEDMADADRDVFAGNYDDIPKDSSEDQIKESEKKYSGEDSSSQVSITEVNRRPVFCNAPDTERVVSHGITFYITESGQKDTSADTAEAGKRGWKVYTEYNGGKYIITGQAEDQDEFLEKVYEALK